MSDLHQYIANHAPEQQEHLHQITQHVAKLAELLNAAALPDTVRRQYVQELTQSLTPLNNIIETWEEANNTTNVLIALRDYFCRTVDVSSLKLSVKALHIDHSVILSFEQGISQSNEYNDDGGYSYYYREMNDESELRIDVDALMALNPDLIGDNEDESLSDQQLDKIIQCLIDELSQACYFEFKYLYDAGPITQEHLALIDQPARPEDLPPLNFE